MSINKIHWKDLVSILIIRYNSHEFHFASQSNAFSTKRILCVFIVLHGMKMRLSNWHKMKTMFVRGMRFGENTYKTSINVVENVCTQMSDDD